MRPALIYDSNSSCYLDDDARGRRLLRQGDPPQIGLCRRKAPPVPSKPPVKSCSQRLSRHPGNHEVPDSSEDQVTGDMQRTGERVPHPALSGNLGFPKLGLPVAVRQFGVLLVRVREFPKVCKALGAVQVVCKAGSSGRHVAHYGFLVALAALLRY